MAPAAELGGAVEARGQRVGDHGHHGPHVRQVGPQAVVGGQVRRVQLPGARRPEVFRVIGPREGVQVDHLRAVRGRDPDDGLDRHGDRQPGPRWHFVVIEQDPRRRLDARVQIAVYEERGAGRGGEVGGLGVSSGRGCVGLLVLVAAHWVRGLCWWRPSAQVVLEVRGNHGCRVGLD